jgi:hypothetical protein
MLFMSVDRSVSLDADQRAALPAAVEAWVAEMDARGIRLQGDVLAPKEALEVASKHPVATFGALEVRPYAAS